MDIKRNSRKTRAFMEWRCLPVGWNIEQDGYGSYLKIVNNINKEYNTIFQGQSWREVCAFCEGVLAANGIDHTRSGKFALYFPEAEGLR